MRRLFASGWMACFSLVALVTVLQALPVINFFLSFLAPSHWSVLLVNLGFVLMAFKGFTQGGRRALRVAPIVWFGGYFTVTAISHLLAYQFYSAIDRHNASQKISWNPVADAVALSHSWSDENHAVSFRAEDLVANYSLNSAYDGPATGANDSFAGYREVRIGLGDCPKGLMNEGPNGTRFVRSELGKVRFAKNLCIRNRKASPPTSTVKFINGGITSSDLILSRDVEPIVASTPDGRSYRLQAGWTRPLTWWPAPNIGCDWPDYTQEPTWCGIKFDRESARNKGRTPEMVITSALGLTRQTLEKRFLGLSWD